MVSRHQSQVDDMMTPVANIQYDGSGFKNRPESRTKPEHMNIRNLIMTYLHYSFKATKQF